MQEVNIVILGAPSVGRTSLVRKLLTGTFSEDALNADWQTPAKYKLKNTDIVLWEPELKTEEYRDREWFKRADGFIVMFSVNDPASFAEADKILSLLQRACQQATVDESSSNTVPAAALLGSSIQRPPVCLVQNKTDLPPKITMAKIVDLTIRQSISCTVSLSIKKSAENNNVAAEEPFTKLLNAMQQHRSKSSEFKQKLRQAKYTFKLPNWKKAKLAASSAISTSKQRPQQPQQLPRQPQLQPQQIMRTTGERVKLNIGGTVFETYKETILKSAQNSLLSELISQESQKSLVDGTFFVDRNPRYFDIVLDFLRTQQIPPPSAALPYDIDHLQSVLNEAMAYRIDDLVTLVHQKLQNERCDFTRRELSMMLCQSKEFQGVFLNGLDMSLLSFSRANLRYARLRKANFRKADLSHANLAETDLTDSDLAEANLVGANFAKATLKNVILTKANLNGSQFSNTLIIQSNLNRISLCSDSQVQAHLVDTAFTSTTFRGASVEGVHFQRVEFNNCDLENVDFVNCTIASSSFKNSNLQGVKFTNCVFEGGSDFANSNLEQVDLSSQQLADSRFINSFLHGTKFTNANLARANFDCADAHGADFSGADLSHAVFTDVITTNAVFNGSVFDQTNIFNSNLLQAACFKPAKCVVLDTHPTYEVDPSIVVAVRNEVTPSTAPVAVARGRSGTLKSQQTPSAAASAAVAVAEEALALAAEEEEYEREAYASNMSAMARSAFGEVYGAPSYYDDDDD